MQNYVAWGWFILGIVLMLLELLSPGFVIFFFGLAAATVALFVWLVPGFGAYWQLAAFSVFSILYLVALRRWVKSVFMGEKGGAADADDEFAGRVGRVIERVRPEAPGRVLVGDAEWAATAAEALEPGTEVKVVSRSNLTLVVKPLGG